MANAQPTGGMSLPSGESVLVTPGGDIVGSARIGGGSRNRSSRRAARRAAQKRAAEAQRKQAEVQRKAEAQRLEIARQAEAQKEQVRIANLRASLLKSNAQKRTKRFIDKRSGDILRITTTARGGNKIVDVENLNRNTIKTTTFEVPRAGGSSRISGGITVATNRTAKNSTDALMSVAQLPPTQQESKSFFDKLEKSQESASQKRKNISLKLKSMKDKTTPEARRLQTELARLTLLTEVTESVIAAKDIGKIIKEKGGEAFNKIKKDPKNIVPIAKAIAEGTAPVITAIADGILREIEETGELLVTSPNEGIVKLGLIWVSFKGTTAGLKITGKVTKAGVNATKKIASGSKNVVIKITKDPGRILRLNTKITNRASGKIIDLRQIHAEELTKKVNDVSKRLTREFEKRSLTKVSLSDKIAVDKFFRKLVRARLQSRLHKFVTPKPRVIPTVKTPKIKVRKKLRKVKSRKKIITLKEVERDLTSVALTKKINIISKRLTNNFIKRNRLKSTLFDKIEVENFFKDKLRAAITNQKSITAKSLNASANKIIKNKGFVKRLIDKVKRGELKFRKKFLTKKKKLVKVTSRKRVITLKEIERDLNAAALTKKIKSVSERLANSLLKRRGLKSTLFDRIELEKNIANRIRKTLSGEKIITPRKILLNSKKIIAKRSVQKEIIEKSLKPEFKIITTKAKRLKIIKEPRFEVITPKISKGVTELKTKGRVLLQKTKQVQKQSNIIRVKMKPLMKKKASVSAKRQLQKQSKQLMLRNKVLTKQLFSLRKLTASAVALVLLSKSATVSASAQKSAQTSLQSFKSDSDVMSASISKNSSAIKSAQSFLQASKTASKLRSRTITKQKTVKKPQKPLFRLPKKKTTTKKGKFDAFVVEFRKGGKFVKNRIPLSFRDAEDFLAYKIDKKLIRTGKLVPVGKVKKLGKLPKGIKGAFNQRKHKLRIFRLKKKKKVKFSPRRFIEKKKYVGDTKSEIRLLKKARAKRKKKKK